jgi:endonuclease/exonuclease/phosphatase family metal-dependent hydrolase
MHHDTARFRLYTHNIWGRHGDWDARRSVLAGGIRTINPDLIALQETIVDGDYDQVADILGEGWHIVHSEARDPGGMGISIASRWPITGWQEPDLNLTPRTTDFPCTSLIAGIAVPPPIGPVLLVNHFPDYQVHHELERERQTAHVASAVEDLVASQPRHVLLAGDLDAEPDSASLRFLAGRQSLDGISVCYRRAWESVHGNARCPTFTTESPLVPAGWPYEEIDHIFVRCGPEGIPTLHIDGCERAFDEAVDGTWASDHFGLVADFSA